MKNIFKTLLCLLFILLIFTNRNILVTSTITSIDLFNKSIFPSIFPIMILSDYIMSTNIINLLSNTIGILFSKIFKCNKCSIYPFIMSCISGTPSNAKYIYDLLKNKCITTKEAEKILSMCLLYNPLLIISLTKYLNKKDSILLIISNIIINILIGLINRNYKIEIINKPIPIKKFNLVTSISNAINTLLSILGIIVLFNIINNLLPIKHPLITGIFEITNGINLINYYPTNYKNKLIYTSILLSFGGLSIITQIKSIFKEENTLNYTLFYKSRIIHLILFYILIFFITP